MSTPKSRKQKGKQLEDFIADKLRSKKIDAQALRDGSSGAGTREKGDIITSAQIFGRNLGIEAKNHKTPHIKDWWEQTQKLELLGREPILVYKLEYEQYEDAKAVIYLDTLLDLIKSYQLQSEIKETNKNFYAIKQIKYWINKIE